MSEPSHRHAGLLALVRQTAIDRDRADVAYGQALQAARDSGFSLAEIANAAGVKRQTVFKQTTRRRAEPARFVEPPWEER